MTDFGIRQAQTGYRVAYHPHETNHCPGCGNSQWIVGRMTAECAFCATALPFVVGASTGISALRRPPFVVPLAA